MGAGDAGRTDHVFTGGIGFHHQQVVAHGAIKEDGILRHYANLTAQGIELHLGDVEAIDQHRALQRSVEAGQQFEQGGFAAAGAAH